MKQRRLFLPVALLCVAALGYEVACDDSPSSSYVAPGGSSGGGIDSGSGGQTPQGPDPTFDAQSLFDSGPPPSLNEGAVCEGVPIGAGTLDQENLAGNGAVLLQATNGNPSQTFTVGVSGYLAGVELAMQRLDPKNPPLGRLRVELYARPSFELLGSAEVPLDKLPLSVPPEQSRVITLTAGAAPGVGYVPFGKTCARLVAGSKYSFKMTLVDVPSGVCSEVGTDAGTCTAGRVGDHCNTNAGDCDPQLWIALSEHNYDGGGWEDGKTGDFVFRTYMQP